MKKNIRVFLKGLAMGACDVVPGVSGGTIAFITGIYDRLINALHSFDLKLGKLVITGRRKQAWKKVDATFLFSLFGGVIVAILSLAKLIEHGLQNHPVAVWGFFFGLILISAIFLLKEVKHKTKTMWGLVILGVIIGAGISLLPILQSGSSGLLGIGFAGMLAIVAMILPGISGSYILLIIGKYTVILATLTSLIDAIKDSDTALILSSGTTVLVFIIGAIIGLLLFAKALHWMKNRYHDQMMAVLTGFMLGALAKVRPRQETLTTYIDRHGIEQTAQTKAILPSTPDQALTGIVAIILGVGIVRGIHLLAQKKSGKKT